MRQRWLAIVVLAALVLHTQAPLVLAAGACATWRTFVTGDSVAASDMNGIQTTLGQTNMVWTCLDDYSANAAQMQTTTDPYASGTESLATTGAGELERLRHVIKHAMGWTQWYTHNEPINLGNRPLRQHLTTITDFRQMFRSEVHLSAGFNTRLHLFAISTTEYVHGAAHPESALILAHVNGVTRFLVTLGGDVHVGGSLLLHAPGSASHAALFSTGNPNRGLFFPTPDSVAITSGGEVLRVHAGGVFFGANNSYDLGSQFGSRPRHIHIGGRLTVPDGSTTEPSITFRGSSTTGLWQNSASLGVQITAEGTTQAIFDTGGPSFKDAARFGATAAAPDAQISRQAANSLAFYASGTATTEVFRYHVGGLMAGVTNSYDIGTVSGSQFRHLHLAGNLTATNAHVSGIAVGSLHLAGTWSSRGQFSGTGGAANADDVFTLRAHAITFMRATNHATSTIVNPGAVDVTITTSGPAAGGRDAGAALSASSWVHFYWIYDGTTVSGTASPNPPTTGPNLPSGYHSWSYAGAVRLNVTSDLVGTHIMGSMAYYHASQLVVSGSTTTSEATADVASYVPPNATAIETQGTITVTATAGGLAISSLVLRTVTGLNKVTITNSTPASTTGRSDGVGMLPNIAQRFYYLAVDGANVSTRSMNIYVQGYALPNGGGS